MTPEQVRLVQVTFSKIEPIADRIARLFYNRLFHTNPALRNLFRDDIDVQGRKLMAILSTAVKGLNNLEKLVPVVQNLGRRHAGYGVVSADYDSVGEALIWTLEQAFGVEFDQNTKTAWLETYTTLSSVMQNAALKAA